MSDRVYDHLSGNMPGFHKTRYFVTVGLQPPIPVAAPSLILYSIFGPIGTVPTSSTTTIKPYSTIYNSTLPKSATAISVFCSNGEFFYSTSSTSLRSTTLIRYIKPSRIYEPIYFPVLWRRRHTRTTSLSIVLGVFSEYLAGRDREDHGAFDSLG